jgi:predicted transcriptional regulator
MISGAQIRAARGLLQWSAVQLGTAAQVSWATIQRFETAEAIPVSRGGTLERIQETLENAGIEFFGDPIQSPGVRLHRDRAQRDN